MLETVVNVTAVIEALFRHTSNVRSSFSFLISQLWNANELASTYSPTEDTFFFFKLKELIVLG